MYELRKSVDPYSLFPELASFKAIVKLLAGAAYVEFADGRPSGGTDLLLESLWFSNNISSGSLISNLVGVAGTAIALAGFDRHLSSLSLADVERVDRAATELLNGPPVYVAAMRREQDMAQTVLSGMFSGPHSMFAADQGEPDDAEFKAIMRLGKSLTPPQREELRARVALGVDAAFQDHISRFEALENTWYGPARKTADAPAKVATSADAARYLVGLLHPGQYGLSWLGKSRTQLRLLRLHARISAYRWRQNKLPGALGEVASADEMADPFAGGEILYELKEGATYRLYGKGNKETGEIDLRYRRQPGTGSERELPADPR